MPHESVSDEPTMRLANQLMQRADHLATFTEVPGTITRRYGTEPLTEVMDTAAGWMRDAGMTTRRDAFGNLFGLLPGPADDAPRLLLGGHLDSVRDAGRYDGILGVLGAIATVQHLRDTGADLPFAVEVAAFADEEGLRFHSLYLGSSAATGTLPAEMLDAKDAGGITAREAIAAFGFDPEGSLQGSLTGHDYLGFIEAHIEQGPRLEAADLPVGVVSGIVGTVHAALDVTGIAGHAGTVPMQDRHDALVAVSAIVVAIDALARAYDDGRATVGEIAVQPGAANVIPGEARISLDVRHPEGTIVDELYERIRIRSGAIAAQHQVEIAWHTGQKAEPAHSDETLNGVLSSAITQAGYEPATLFSGAGHDAAALARIMPATMLFVRCKNGISHNPAESITTDDAAVAIDVLSRFVTGMAITNSAAQNP